MLATSFRRPVVRSAAFPKPRGWACVLALGLALLVGCDKGASSPSTPVSPTPPTSPIGASSEAFFIGAGDIGYCEPSGATPGATATAAIIERMSGVVFTAGDNAYMHGRLTDFQQCYDKSWGRFKSRTWATPGNHEYETPGASGYFDYYGERAGPYGVGYYSYDVGPWHVVSLNSEIPMSPGSAQAAWLRADLQARRTACTAAIIHRPLLSSGPNGDNPGVRDLWQILAEAGADLVISGHDHHYERHAAIDPNGVPSSRGMRLFTVGTGGAPIYRSGGLRPTSEAKVMEYGVIRFTFQPTGYRWEFHTSSGIVDSGVDVCH
ncbi:metallophosphoesterase [Luteitalea sp. TBR-22]|uniref:metallophosphoesterase family protein n=1 Tax=Luteitalea sp. TBR-22 TaxID=2802971 RepID=UPI001EF47E52|nr:metallophosphoesterase [Luteitalea sp. TBR-22]